MTKRRNRATYLLYLLALLLTLSACASNQPTLPNDELEPAEIYTELKQRLAEMPTDYPSQAAVDDGRFVIVHGQLRSEPELASDFISKAQTGKEASLVIVQYTIEGDPIITNLYFNGTVYHGVEDYTRDAFKGTADYSEFSYQELHVFETDDKQLVYLSNDPDLTWEQLLRSLLSSNSDDIIDCRMLYAITK